MVGLISATILGFAIVHATLRFWGAVTLSNLVQRIVINLRSDVYNKLQRLSFRFFDANQSGSIINRVAGDVQAVRQFVDGVILQVLTVLLSLAVYLVYMLSVNVPLTVACLATTPLLWLGAVIFSRSVRPEYLRNSGLVDRADFDAVGKCARRAGGERIRPAAGGNRKIRRGQSRGDGSEGQNLLPAERVSAGDGIFNADQHDCAAGLRRIFGGERRIGAGCRLVCVRLNLLQQFANQVGQVTNIANSIQASLTGAERVFEVLDAPLEVENPVRPAS